ncbi:MAG: hypothetical protein LUG18_13350 [Candidatus Azobacteroides sp.]|nr:hypothetical protein [Candidatus Azobacteroides sp.]
MKKLLFCVLSMVLFSFSSCNDEGDNTFVSEELYPVVLNVTNGKVADFSILRIAQPEDNAEIRQYFVYVYDSSGTLVQRVGKIIDDENDTTIDLMLTKGDYTAILLAFNEELMRDSHTDHIAQLWLEELEKAVFYSYRMNPIGHYYGGTVHPSIWNNHYYNDYFYRKIPFTVDSEGETTVDLEATRITGRLELYMQDIAPFVEEDEIMDNVVYIQLELEGFPFGVKFSDNSSFLTSEADNQTVLLSRKQWAEFAERPLVINCRATDSPKITVTLEGSDAVKVIEGFEIYENTITRLTGNLNLESVNTDANLSLSISTDWDNVITGDL